jgi:hypothetical protein
MNLTEQHNKAKEELLTLYQMMVVKIESIKGIAPRSEVRRVEDELRKLRFVLENYFDFHNNNDCNGILYGCRIADRY